MLKALLFDLDGTLTDTDPLHFLCWQTMLKPFGYKIDYEFYRSRISGRLNADIVQDLLPRLAPPAALIFEREKEACFRARALALEPLPGLVSLLAAAHKKGLSTMVVTNAPGANARFTLDILGLVTSFDAVVLAEDAAAGKPDPASYQEALRKLSIQPSQALAFEDSVSGVLAAVKAGIRVVGLTTTRAADILMKVGAYCTVADFRTPSIWELAGLDQAVS